MNHAAGFLKLVNEAKQSVREISVAEARELLAKNSRVVLVDIREDHEWLVGHAEEAMHLGKGILERDLESRFPDPETELILYCGGGFRSALSAEAAQKMGYRHVRS